MNGAPKAIQKVANVAVLFSIIITSSDSWIIGLKLYENEF